jgi:hypothetical protein
MARKQASKSKRKVNVKNLAPKTGKGVKGGSIHAGEIDVQSKKRS